MIRQFSSFSQWNTNMPYFFCSQLQQVLFFRVLVVHNEISIFHFIRMIFNLVTNYHISLIYN